MYSHQCHIAMHAAINSGPFVINYKNLLLTVPVLFPFCQSLKVKNTTVFCNLYFKRARVDFHNTAAI